MRIKSWFYSLPIRKVFLLDAIGAMVSIAVLLLVVNTFQSILGIAYSTIHLLAIIACGYFLYSISCYLFLREKLLSFLKVIAVLNCLYGLFILLLLFQEYSHLSLLGVLYMIGDATIVFSVGVVELFYIKKN